MNYTDDKYKHSDLTERIIRCAYNVFDELGSGFLENVYRNALQIELKRNNFKVEVEYPIKVLYRGIEIGHYYADLCIENKIRF
ncbi:MAG: GxxExxY protein [Syntrophomonadaceae bacterium]|jgi:GxxExxY protein